METYRVTLAQFIHTLKQKNIIIFNSYDIDKLFTLNSTQVRKQLLVRMVNAHVIQRITKNNYIFLHGGREAHHFEIANSLVPYSYISLESALSYYGILDQFSYTVTSVTMQKTRQIRALNSTFSYSHVAVDYFSDYVKKDTFLIATEQKAIFDYLYFAYKGRRSVQIIDQLKEGIVQYDVSTYIHNYAHPLFISFLKRYVEL